MIKGYPELRWTGKSPFNGGTFYPAQLKVMWELLSDTGTLYIQCDWHKSHQLRCILDEIFGPNNIINEIVWEYQGSWVSPKNKFPYRNQSIYIYSKTDRYNFNVTYEAGAVEKGVYTKSIAI